MASSQKKQQTLSAFFKKPVSSQSSTLPRTPALEDDEDEDLVLPIAKKRRITPAAETAGVSKIVAEGKQEHIRTLRPVEANGQTTATTSAAPSGSDRTSKYIFSSSPLQENREVDDPGSPDRRRKDELHRRFVKKLGKPDSIAEIKRRNRTLEEDAPEQENGDADDEPEEVPKPTGRLKTGVKKGGSKLTPMEKQVIEIKKAHMDTLLVVEVGYKFRFFGEDARIAARELGIVCIPGKYRFDEDPSEAHLDRFASASIPVHRLHVHVKRLVAAGHKVGVVRQLETAALKAVGDNRNAPFVRKLTNLYTKGTYIDDIEGDGRGSPAPQSPSTGFLLCMTEVNVKGHGNDEKVHVGLVAVQPATGDVVYDDFEDGFMRSEIETRLLHIAPCEFLIVGELSKATEKLVLHLSGSKTNVFGDKIRVERTPKLKTMAAQAHGHISTFYAGKLKDTQGDQGKATKVFDKILGLPENVTLCLSAMINHLSEYGLEHVFRLTKYFQPFSARSHMLLNGTTLTSLEVYQNQTDHSTRGSLYWMMDRTQTRFGGRLLRKWVGRPLLDRKSIEERLSAVEELLDPDKAIHVEKLKHVLSKMRTDLEKNLIRIYYGKASRPELLNVLQSLQFLATEFAHVTDAASTNFDSSLISSAITSLPSILTEVVGYLDKINLQAARSDDKYNFFQDGSENDTITEHKFGIAGVEHDLDEFRSTAAEKLGKKRPVEYATVAGIDYLIEVDNSSATIKKVPASWTKISGTKKVSRFHAPEVVKLLRERDQHKESLAAACDKAYTDLLVDISTKYQLFRDTVQSLARLDCLLALANVAAQPGYVRPRFTEGSRIEVEGARHPMVEQLLIDTYVPNNISISQDATRALLVTGPNMGGKSSYVRSVALISIMAQIGSFVPATSATLGILDAVFTRMGAFDNMMSGESTFMVELSETSDILKLATDRSLVVLDELGRGTSTHDGVAIAASVLDYLVRERKCLTLFITHYQMLARLASGFAHEELKNVHMRFTEEDDENVTFLYEVAEGVAHRSYGLNVARLANIGESVIDIARQKSAELETATKARQLAALARMLAGAEERSGGGGGGGAAAGGGHKLDVERLDAIVEGIEML
ncbi:DNA mismatch repair protein msh3 [Capronia epimyces CBS 606.96]|uniref:DNA mismatch repair protein MSH3 n=1 Tax=Capronia epimyces CBS 606.96 TaxID=1182542 RepID=W9XPD1_9EURO|nr:DNA mismatch repair protein msh3 [Capronia epimyces CBS 606.96]EXJ79195.1 DNA mismatch repair protein msh3 [Capronia epimyces CBS 606.96]